MSEYVKCIMMEGDRRTLCGRETVDFCFQGIDHAYNEAARDGRLETCKACAQVVIDEITSTWEDLDDGEA